MYTTLLYSHFEEEISPITPFWLPLFCFFLILLLKNIMKHTMLLQQSLKTHFWRPPWKSLAKSVENINSAMCRRITAKGSRETCRDLVTYRVDGWWMRLFWLSLMWRKILFPDFIQDHLFCTWIHLKMSTLENTVKYQSVPLGT